MIAGFHWVCPARVLRWLDGDTCEVDIDMGWRVTRAREKIRLLGLYCPEMSEVGGLEARFYANRLAPPGTIVTVTSKSLGKGAEWTGAEESLSRTLGDIRLPDGRDFAATMVADGFGKSRP
jgi:endonuclease YncB( thermonuclease family)